MKCMKLILILEVWITIDSNLEQCINNSENSKSNNKILKDLNKTLDNIINKLVKSIDLTGKTNENSVENI